MISYSEQTSATPLTFRANSTEAAFLQGFANALGITPDEALERVVRRAIRCSHTSKNNGKRKEVAQRH